MGAQSEPSTRLPATHQSLLPTTPDQPSWAGSRVRSHPAHVSLATDGSMRHVDHILSDMVSARDPPICLAILREGKDLIDDRPDLVGDGHAH